MTSGLRQAELLVELPREAARVHLAVRCCGALLYCGWGRLGVRCWRTVKWANEPREAELVTRFERSDGKEVSEVSKPK